MTSTSAARTEAPSTQARRQRHGQRARRGEHSDCRPAVMSGTSGRRPRGMGRRRATNVANAPSPEANESSPKARSPPESSPAGIRTSSVAISPLSTFTPTTTTIAGRIPGPSRHRPALANDSSRPAFVRPVCPLGAPAGTRRSPPTSTSSPRTRAASPWRRPGARAHRALGPATNAADSSPAVSALVRSRRACRRAVANRPHQGGERRCADRDENEEKRHQHQRRRRRAQGDPERGDQRTTPEAGDREHVPGMAYRPASAPATGEHNRYGANRTAATVASQLVPTPRRSSSAATSTNGAPWAMLPSTNVVRHLATPPPERLAAGCRSTAGKEPATR